MKNLIAYQYKPLEVESDFENRAAFKNLSIHSNDTITIDCQSDIDVLESALKPLRDKQKAIHNTSFVYADSEIGKQTERMIKQLLSREMSPREWRDSTVRSRVRHDKRSKPREHRKATFDLSDIFKI
ncbi:hypothetical protein ACHELW_000760 [Vibrio vulnificus]